MTSALRYGMVALLCVSLLLLGCGRKNTTAAGKKKSTIQVKGSDTMVNVAQAWAEEYKKVKPEVEIEVSGGGSGVGIAALEKGTIDIATASRNIKPDEIDNTKKNTGKDPTEFVVGFDALAIFVNKENPLNRITFAQLAQIYAENGTTTRWSQLDASIPGVKKDKIVLVSRQSSSGTYEFFRERVLKKQDFKLGSLDMNGSKEVVELVSHAKTAIGYSGMGYATPNIKMLDVAVKPDDTAYAPTVENTIAKKYPLARSLQLYTLGEPQGPVKEFIDWILSDDGQKILRENGFVPIRTVAASN
jgi:phosphate transport system substrate-binding protein